MGNRIKLNREEIKHLYFNKKKSCSQIAIINNVSIQTILNRFKDWDFKLRTMSEEVKGRKHTQETKEKIREGNLKRIITIEHRRNISISRKGKQFKPRKWTRKKLIEAYLELPKTTKTDLRKKYRRYFGYAATKRYWGSLDELAEDTNKPFLKAIRVTTGKIGKNEKQILDRIEKEQNIKLERQFPVVGKFIDGYDLINNVAYEVDEPYHKYKEVEDFIREKQIKENLGCSVVRLKEAEWI